MRILLGCCATSLMSIWLYYFHENAQAVSELLPSNRNFSLDRNERLIVTFRWQWSSFFFSLSPFSWQQKFPEDFSRQKKIRSFGRESLWRSYVDGLQRTWRTVHLPSSLIRRRNSIKRPEIVGHELSSIGFAIKTDCFPSLLIKPFLPNDRAPRH